MKTCKKCNIEKDKSQFGRLKGGKDGLNPRCKKCQREKMREWLSRPGKREQANKNAARFRRTEKGKTARSRYYKSPKGQSVYKKYNERSKSKHAREAVNHAVEAGKIPAAKKLTCIINENCKGRMEYHHHKGYHKKNWFDVIPLCKKHHCIMHGMNYHD
jgi:hypothetical protein